MERLFDAMNDYTEDIWKNPNESLMFIQNDIIRLKSPAYIGLALNNFALEGAKIPKTIKEAKALWDDAISKCSTINEVAELSIKICCCFDTHPHRTSQWNRFLNIITEKHDLKKHIMDYLFLSYKYSGIRIEISSSGNKEKKLGKFLPFCKELQIEIGDDEIEAKTKDSNTEESRGIGDLVSYLISVVTKRKSDNIKSENMRNLHYHEDSLYSIMLKGEKHFQSLEKGKGYPSPPPRDVRVSSFYDALINFGLICHNKMNPYLNVLEYHLNNRIGHEDDSSLDVDKFLNSFSLEEINFDKLNCLDRVLSKYIVERVTNTNFIYSLCDLVENTIDSHFKKAIVEIAKFLVLHPLVEYRIHIMEELKSLVNDYNSYFTGALYDQLISESPNKLLDLMTDEESYQLYEVMDDNSKKIIKNGAKSILMAISKDEQREILNKFTIEEMKSEIVRKIIGEKKMDNLKDEKLISTIIGVTKSEFIEIVEEICRIKSKTLIDLIPKCQLKILIGNLPKKMLEDLLRKNYEKILRDRLSGMPFDRKGSSLGQKDMILRPASDSLMKVTWEYMPEELLAIILYHSFVYFPILTYVFHACLAFRSKLNLPFNDCFCEGNDKEIEIRNKKFSDIDALFLAKETEVEIRKNQGRDKMRTKRKRYILSPKISKPTIDFRLNGLIFDVYSIFYESRTWKVIDPIDLTSRYLCFYYKPIATNNISPSDPMDWMETWYASIMRPENNPFFKIGVLDFDSNGSNERINVFDKLKWKDDSSGGLIIRFMSYILQLKYHNTIDKCIETFVQDWYNSILYLEEDSKNKFRPDSVDPYKPLNIPFNHQFY